MQDSTFADIDLSDFSSFIFKATHVFMKEKDNPAEKVLEEDLDGIEIDGILNLGNLLRTVFMD